MTDRLRAAVQAALEACGKVPTMSVYATEKMQEVESILRAALDEPETLTPTELAARIARGEKWALAEPDNYEDYRLRIERLVRENQKLKQQLDFVTAVLEKGLSEKAKAVRPSPPAPSGEVECNATRLCADKRDNPSSFILGWRAAEAWHEIRHREWVTLTDEEVKRTVFMWSMLNSQDKLADLVRLAERFVREKNA